MPDRLGAEGWVRPVLTGDLADGAVRTILQWPDPGLRERCEPSGYLDGPSLRALAADLLATMYAAGGRGLAAPQLGILRRVFVMDSGWKEGHPDPMVVMDPEILARTDETEVAEELCLSAPDRPMAVRRPTGITLGWYDLDGRHHLRQMSGAEARIAQHEADHLDGRLILKD
ncbi:peptide deformylase [Paracoccus sp. (in: a-proteobacteria)]|uniref:peptide deformylase n=1 Tax=Paracoccus sp. TaxID=267 RepID=UPI00396CDD74